MNNPQNPDNLRTNALLAKVYTFPGVFQPGECKQMLELKQQAYKHEASQINDRTEMNQEVRNSINHYIGYTPDSEWAYQRVMAALNKYSEVMHFGVSRFEPLLVLEYQPGAFYTWHIDLGDEQFSTRKISLVMLLSAPGEYAGGELEFMTSDAPFEVKLNQGDAALFPSYLLHRVKPVTKGVRHTLVCWAHGHAFG